MSKKTKVLAYFKNTYNSSCFIFLFLLLSITVLSFNSQPALSQLPAAKPPSLTAKDVPKLLEELKAPSSQVKYDAMFKLSGVEPKSATVPAIHQLVILLKHDPDQYVRQRAADSLRLLPSTSESANALFAAIYDPARDMSLVAANAVPIDERYVTQLIKAMHHSNWEVRSAIINRFQMAKLKDPAVTNAITAALFDPSMFVRRAAAQTLKEYGKNAATAEPALIQSLKNEKDDLTCSCLASALVTVGHIRYSDLPVLQSRLRINSEFCTQFSCAQAIGLLGSAAAPAIDDLIYAIEHSSNALARGYSAEALGKIGSTAHKAIPVLIKMLQNRGEDNYRAMAAEALGKVSFAQDGNTVNVLMVAKTDRNNGVRDAAVKALEKIGIETQPVTIAADNHADEMALDLADADRSVRQKALLQLLHQTPIVDSKYTVQLIKLLNDPDTLNHWYAAQVLAKIGPPAKAAIPYLVRVLSTSTDCNMQINTATALAKIGPNDRTALNALCQHLLRRDRGSYTSASAQALASLGQSGVPYLTQGLLDSDKAIPYYCACALGGMGTGAVSAIPALLKVLGDKSHPTIYMSEGGGTIRCAAIRALANIAPNDKQAVAAMTAIAGDKHDSPACFDAAQSLKKMGH